MSYGYRLPFRSIRNWRGLVHYVKGKHYFTGPNRAFCTCGWWLP